MTPPIVPVKLPSILKGQRNGDIDPALLAVVDSKALGRLMLANVADAIKALHAFAVSFGIIFASTGRYRPLRQQYDMFITRYEPCTYPEYLVAKAFKRSKQWLPVNRALVATQLSVTVPDSTYWRKIQRPDGSYPASAAVPGTSNHGLAVADDLAEKVGGKLVSLRRTTREWLYEWAPLYGFALETTAELWHWHWIMGDDTPPLLKGDIMQRWRYTNDIAVFAVAGLRCRWIQDGNIANDVAPATGPTVAVGKLAFSLLDCDGPLPPGWTPTDFASYTPPNPGLA